MLHQLEISCPHCQSNNLVKQGKSGNGTQKWQCNTCKKTFSIRVSLQNVAIVHETKHCTTLLNIAVKSKK